MAALETAGEVKIILSEMLTKAQSDDLLVEGLYLLIVQMYARGEVSGMRQVQNGVPRLDAAHEAQSIIKPIKGMVVR